MSRVEEKLTLDRIVFIGRTYEEYMHMFNLQLADLEGRRILDCPAGACSFTAIANRLGIQVTAADIAYTFNHEQLRQKGLQDIEHAMIKMMQVQHNYVWDMFTSIEALKSHRLQALSDSTTDRAAFPDRYVTATLPVLPFEDKQFDVTLSAHFLFTYADRLDFDFHMQVINELIRVTREEIRIFPLVDLAGNRYEQLNEIMLLLENQGCRIEEEIVPYEVQKGAKHMLKVHIPT